MNIEFVSYTGRYPNLCRGVLTLKIDEKEVKFGHDSCTFDYDTMKYKDDNYDSFWQSGGACGFKNNYANSYVNQHPWELSSISDLPEYLIPYADDLITVFNENVRYGCCGGCL